MTTMRPVVTVEAKAQAQGWECAVSVSVGDAAHRYVVLVGRGDLERWGRAGESPDAFVVRAFDFLLARESPGQILPRFAVPDIVRYFPEFDAEIRR